MPAATLVLKTRQARGEGLVELVVWRVPAPVPPSEYGFKYRLVYLVGGVRVVGYDTKAARDAGLLAPQALDRLLTNALKRQQAADSLLSVARLPTVVCGWRHAAGG